MTLRRCGGWRQKFRDIWSWSVSVWRSWQQTSFTVWQCDCHWSSEATQQEGHRDWSSQARSDTASRSPQLVVTSSEWFEEHLSARGVTGTVHQHTAWKHIRQLTLEPNRTYVTYRRNRTYVTNRRRCGGWRQKFRNIWSWSVSVWGSWQQTSFTVWQCDCHWSSEATQQEGHRDWSSQATRAVPNIRFVFEPARIVHRIDYSNSAEYWLHTEFESE